MARWQDELDSVRRVSGGPESNGRGGRADEPPRCRAGVSGAQSQTVADGGHAVGDVKQGRWTANIEGDFVVFLIGARLQARHPLRSLRDLGGFKRGMPAMLKYLSQHPEKGFLGYQQLGIGTANVQYWRSFADLERFAQDQDDPHLAPWRAYWKRVGRSDRTGIWHETYLVRAGEYEAIYGNMPAYGLAKAGEHLPLSSDTTARRRLRRAET